jgi:hypothetical protein
VCPPLPAITNCVPGGISGWSPLLVGPKKGDAWVAIVLLNVPQDVHVGCAGWLPFLAAHAPPGPSSSWSSSCSSSSPSAPPVAPSSPFLRLRALWRYTPRADQHMCQSVSHSLAPKPVRHQNRQTKHPVLSKGSSAVPYLQGRCASALVCSPAAVTCMTAWPHQSH